MVGAISASAPAVRLSLHSVLLSFVRLALSERSGHGRLARPRWHRSPRAGGGSSSDREVRFRGQAGKPLFPLSLTASDPVKRSFGSIHSTCLSAIVTDRAMKA